MSPGKHPSACPPPSWLRLGSLVAGSMASWLPTNGQPLLCFCGLCQDLTGPFLLAFLLSVASGLQSTPPGLLGSAS